MFVHNRGKTIEKEPPPKNKIPLFVCFTLVFIVSIFVFHFNVLLLLLVRAFFPVLSMHCCVSLFLSRSLHFGCVQMLLLNDVGMA